MCFNKKDIPQGSLLLSSGSSSDKMGEVSEIIASLNVFAFDVINLLYVQNLSSTCE